MESTSQYLGKLCFRHPELAGLRGRTNRSCVGCHKIWVEAAHKKIRAIQQLTALPTKKDKLGPSLRGRACDLHPELNGARRSNHACVQCHREYTARWKALNRDKYLAQRKRAKAAKKSREEGIGGSSLRLVVDNR